MTEYFAKVQPTYLEAWPQALHSMSFASVGMKLSLAEAEALGASIAEYGETFPPPHYRDLSGIVARLAARIDGVFPKGFVVRLGSRSPKDSWEWARSPKVATAEGALGMLTSCSERISDDLHLAICNQYEPWIWCRAWIEIPKWAEFRCFMQNRRLVGISLYNYRDRGMPELSEHASSIEWAIRDCFFPQFASACHLDDVVFDVFVMIKQRVTPTGMTERAVEVKLIEINPFTPMTDPCWFDWNREGDFDGGFRVTSLRGK